MGPKDSNRKMKKLLALSWDSLQDRKLLSQSLKNGDIVVGTSDTVFGLLATCSLQGKMALDSTKKRSSKPYLMLVGGVKKVFNFIDTPVLRPELLELMEQCWPGPLTLILPVNPEIVRKGFLYTDTVAIRVPSHEGLQALLEEHEALFSTSANISGFSVPDSLNELDPHILNSVSLSVVDSKPPTKLSSTIINCSVYPYRLVRVGAYPLTKIQAILNNHLVSDS
jgi:L-threonylcarbamoyladenylate synthase